jgi:hypothetical protein
MLTKVHKRGWRVGGLVGYLYGPGRREEHINPRLVAAWPGAGPLAELEPTRLQPEGPRDFRHLLGLLQEPLLRRRQPPQRPPVWHASMRLAPEDRHRVFSDQMWGHIAGEMLRGAGLVVDGDQAGVRWVVIRHADDHVHIVATLVREDGRVQNTWNDRPRCVAATAELSRRLGLRVVGTEPKTVHRRPHQSEVHKARRLGRGIPVRDELRRRVRTALAGAGGEDDFFARLAAVGLLVRFRYSTLDPDQVTGYAVALPGATTAAGQPLFYSGGKLAPDLTLPKVRQRLASPTGEPAPPGRPRRRGQAITAPAPAVWQAGAAIRDAADFIARTAHADPAAAQAAAQAAADTLTVAAWRVEGDRGGPLTRAAEVFDQAARDLYGRVARPTSRSYQLRAMARVVALIAELGGDDQAVATLRLILDLSRFGDALAHLRETQGRLHQARSAREAAAALRTAASPGSHRATDVATLAATVGGRVSSADLHRHPDPAPQDRTR